MKSPLCLLLFSLLLAAWSPVPAAAQSVLTGTVTDTQNQPLAGATVTVEGSFLGVTTDYEGRYRLEGLRTGPVAVEARYLGFSSATANVTLEPGVNRKDFTLEPSVIEQSALLVTATRATARTPVAYTDVTDEELERRDLGQDIPMLLDLTPSVVTSSDAGAGIGYTDMRIRGTDQTRINVTINGVPLNDSESQAVFWVDLPDFSSSLRSVQIQRGVGTSTNGAAAFGATVNLQTSPNASSAFAEADLTYGSFNTQKYNVAFGSGLLDSRWAVDARLSRIISDGYVDRAESDLKSYYVSAGYFGERTTAQLVHFNGFEETYQAWYGTPEASLTGDVEAKQEYALTEGLTPEQTENLLRSDRRYNHYLYENEIDDYRQSHLQLHLIHSFRPDLSGSLTFHRTAGRGYYEQYREDDAFADYGLASPVIGDVTIDESDFVRRRWLDNDFYGAVVSLNAQTRRARLTFGGGFNDYTGDHFGELIWAEYALGTDIRDRYYDNTGDKQDGHVFGKVSYDVTGRLSAFADLQYRAVGYSVDGIDNDLRPIAIDESFGFLNPKVGLHLQLDPQSRLFTSFAVANREPSRTDYLDAADVPPTPETLYNLEAGIERRGRTYALSANLYAMEYTDQLVATGALNDVGALVKVNVPDSYRRGVELQAAYQPAAWITWAANYTFSRNRIMDFTEVVYDYTDGFDVVTNTYAHTDIALSPSHVGAGSVTVVPAPGLEVALLAKYVGRQYLDNTSNPDRTIDPFFVNDLRVAYTFPTGLLRDATAKLLVSNLFDVDYASRGYTYTYIYGEQFTRNHYYPQAGLHVLAGLSLGF